MAHDDDDDDAEDQIGSSIIGALTSGNSSPSLDDSFKNAFLELGTEQRTTGLGSRNGGNYTNLPDLSGPNAKVNVTERMQTATNFFVSKGWTQEQAVGIVANLYAESGLRTDLPGDGGQAYGIAQWHSDRQAEFGVANGNPNLSIRGSTFEQQLNLVNYELTQGSERGAGDRLRAATDARSAAAVISKYYERPADRDGQANYRARLASGIIGSAPFSGAPSLVSAMPYHGNHPSMAVGAALESNGGGHVVLIGDSIGQGLGNALASKGFDVDNQAVVGSGLFNQRNVDWLSKSSSLAQSMHPGDHLVLMMGRNDVGYSPAALKTKTNQLMANLKLAQERGVDVTIVSPAYAGDKDAGAVSDVAQTYRDAAINNGLKYVDINQGAPIPRGPDGIHMASSGYAQLANRFVSATPIGHDAQIASNGPGSSNTILSKFNHLFGISA